VKLLKEKEAFRKRSNDKLDKAKGSRVHSSTKEKIQQSVIIKLVRYLIINV
jgi:hypothetical protein